MSECVEACSNAYYKESNVFKSCIQIVETQGRAKSQWHVLSAEKCAEVCEAGAITQNAKRRIHGKKNCVPAAESVWEACPFGLMVKS